VLLGRHYFMTSFIVTHFIRETPFSILNIEQTLFGATNCLVCGAVRNKITFYFRVLLKTPVQGRHFALGQLPKTANECRTNL